MALAAPSPAPRWHAAVRSPVVAVFCVVALLTGASAAAAADWLQIFRTEQIAPVFQGLSAKDEAVVRRFLTTTVARLSDTDPETTP